MWLCNHTVQLPEGVAEVEFHYRFNHPVTLPSSLRQIVFRPAAFRNPVYSHPLNFPDDLEELAWSRKHGGLTLPEGLQKLTWGSTGTVELPSSLRELRLCNSAPLTLLMGLQKVTFEWWCRGHYNVPESVQEVVISCRATFTHPTTLQHLIVNQGEIDISHCRVHKLTIHHCLVRIKQWPEGLKELAFIIDEEYMYYHLQVPKGCRIVGDKLPGNVTME